MGFFSKLFGKKETKQDLVNFPDFLQAKKFNDELKKAIIDLVLASRQK